jgi:hypothetical protein
MQVAIWEKEKHQTFERLLCLPAFNQSESHMYAYLQVKKYISHPFACVASSR